MQRVCWRRFWNEFDFLFAALFDFLFAAAFFPFFVPFVFFGAILEIGNKTKKEKTIFT